MKKVGIIGLGTITEYYLEGIKNSNTLELTAVCDTLINSVSKKYYEEYPFYLDYKEMISKEGLDYIIISTPPKSHFEIAKHALENNVNVIVEKPATTNLNDLQFLNNLAIIIQNYNPQYSKNELMAALEKALFICRNMCWRGNFRDLF